MIGPLKTGDPIVIAVRDLSVRVFSSPCRITTVQWVVVVENGDIYVERAVTTPEQFDSVMQEYLSALSDAYRPT